MNLVLLKNISLVGIFWGAYSTKEPSHIPGVWKEILKSVPQILSGLRVSFLLCALSHHRLLGSGKAKSIVYSDVYTLEKLVEGLGALESRKSWGKVIVRVKDDASNERAKL